MRLQRSSRSWSIECRIPGNLRDLSKGYFATTFLSSSPPTPAMQSSLQRLTCKGRPNRDLAGEGKPQIGRASCRAAAGTSLDGPKITAAPAWQGQSDPRTSLAAEILALGPSCVSPHAAAQTRIVSVVRIRLHPDIRAPFQRDILRRRF